MRVKQMRHKRNGINNPKSAGTATAVPAGWPAVLETSMINAPKADSTGRRGDGWQDVLDRCPS